MRVPHARVYTSAYTHVPHACMGTGHIYMCAPRTCVHKERMRVDPTHGRAHTFSRVACMIQGSVHAWCFVLLSLPSAHGFHLLPVYLQGIDRSHSWVNSAYAPGGSKAVLRRAPPYCGADPRQVPSLPAPARV